MAAATGWLIGVGLTVLPLAVAAGCRAPTLIVDDAIRGPNGKTRLVAGVEREPVLAMGGDIEHARVRFFVNEREVGDTKSDDEGVADIEHALDARVERFEARAAVAGQELRAAGRVFAWDRQRISIAVDIDHTIAQTEYKDLLRNEREEGSDPLKRSVSTLSRLAADFQILYLTGRPRALLDKTRAWLDEHKFPAGPVITAESVRQTLRPGAFKQQKLRGLRKTWPRLLIGIGNTVSDADAYGANEMLTLMIAPEAKPEFGRHALVFKDWKALGRFFDANRDVLLDAERLKDAIEGKVLLQQAVPRYEKR